MRFSILQLLEVTFVLGTGLALDRMMQYPNSAALMGTVIVWGSVAGAYLGFRWSKRRDMVSVVARAAVAAATLTFLNAARIEIPQAEQLRRSSGGDYFRWTYDWPLLAAPVCLITFNATLCAVVLVLLPLAISGLGVRPGHGEED